MVIKTDDGRKIPQPSRVLVISNPPKGMCFVKNIYVNPKTRKLVVKWDDEPKK